MAKIDELAKAWDEAISRGIEHRNRCEEISALIVNDLRNYLGVQAQNQYDIFLSNNQSERVQPPDAVIIDSDNGNAIFKISFTFNQRGLSLTFEIEKGVDQGYTITFTGTEQKFAITDNQIPDVVCDEVFKTLMKEIKMING